MRPRSFEILFSAAAPGADDDLEPGGSLDPSEDPPRLDPDPLDPDPLDPDLADDPTLDVTPPPAEPEPPESEPPESEPPESETPGPTPSEPEPPAPPTPDLPPPEPPAPAPPAPEPPPAAQAPWSPPEAEDYPTISATRILEDRPDVLKAFYEAYYRHNDGHSTAWKARVGGDTPEAYATYWYREYGKYEGYAQSATTAGDNVSLARILQERPDVLRAYYEGFYRSDPHSTAWRDRIGGDTAEDYAKYWYNRYGKYEGYAQTDKAAAENISVERLLQDRPDVFRAFYTEFYGAHNDRHSKAWVERVGGDTVQDYAKYWYETYGKQEGYTQRPAAPGPAAPPQEEPAPAEPSPPPQDPLPADPPPADPPAEELPPPPEEPPPPEPLEDGWDMPLPEDFGEPEADPEPVVFDAFATLDEALLSVGRAFGDPEIFG